MRARPDLYFGVGRDSPELPTEVLQRVVRDALHHGDGTHGRISVEIGSDLCFTVEDDRRRSVDEQGRPLPGFYDSLLDRERCVPAAAAALSVVTVVEVRLDGLGYRQELAGTKPTGDWEEFPAHEPDGTRVTFWLDPSYCGDGEAIAWALRPEELHEDTCEARPSFTAFPIHDRRPGDGDGGAGAGAANAHSGAGLGAPAAGPAGERASLLARPRGERRGGDTQRAEP